jgi:hypothetical protein
MRKLEQRRDRQVVESYQKKVRTTSERVTLGDLFGHLFDEYQHEEQEPVTEAPQTVAPDTALEAAPPTAEAETQALAVPEETGPIAAAPTPEAEIEAPEAETEAPEVETEAPEVEIEAPAAEIEAPEAEIEVPEVEDEVPEPPAVIAAAEPESGSEDAAAEPESRHENLTEEPVAAAAEEPNNLVETGEVQESEESTAA